ncbi:MAG: hypothetical protein ACLP50_14120 [Solirubrobacteraceae bacterium]
MLDFGDGAVLARQANDYFAAWPGQGSRPLLWVGSGTVRAYVPTGTDIYGLLGRNRDGDPTNDLVTADGVQLPDNMDATTLYGNYADSWRVNADASLFTYAPGQSTATFTDTSFPSSVLTINDLSDSALAAGTVQCANSGVVDGPQFDDCVMDWAETQDPGFVTAAAAQAGQVTQAGAEGVDSSGDVSEDFSGPTVPSNFGGSWHDRR